jgi:uncharacterized membrane protein YfcA
MGDLNLFSFLIFIAGGFAASLITALAGFAFGIIVAGPWLHVTPSQTTALIVAYGLVVQGYSVWKLRAAIKIGRLLPFLLGGAIGSPLGVQLLRWVSATHLRLGVGAVLIVYAAHGLLRPNLPRFAGTSPFRRRPCRPVGRRARRRHWTRGNCGHDLVGVARVVQG